MQKMDMADSNAALRDSIIVHSLAHIPFDGWTWAALERGAQDDGFKPDMAHAVFPGGIGEALSCFSDLADRWMLERLEDTDPTVLRVRDRVRTAVETRFAVLQPYKEAVRLSLARLSLHSPQATRLLWCSADRIWIWSGDTATDYNRYTKRGLLAGILGASTLCWLNDESPQMTATKGFIDRRIENVMQLGKVLGRFKRSEKAGAGA